MVFESLSDKLQGVFKKLKGQAVLNEKNIDDALREVKLALLDADVNFKVVNEFVSTVKEKAIGSDVLQNLTSSQQLIKIVNEELTELLGGSQSKVAMSPTGFTTILMAGLQGTGKTTTSGKLAKYFKDQGKNPMLAACDVYRPAAIDQLKVVGDQVGVPVFTLPDSKKPEVIAEKAVKEAKRNGHDILIIDTSGRLHIDEALMEELSKIKAKTKPDETLLVIDAMTGQDAVNTAEGFSEQIGIDGIILTKMDGDTRGGAALSAKKITGKPIKFAGMGEKLDALEPFYPDRMASRILGMGDMLSLIEKAEAAMDEKQAAELEKKIKKMEFTLEDFLDQLQQIKKMGNVSQLMGMIPGVDKAALKNAKIDEKEFVRMEALIQSMTPEERRKPELLNANRRKRIAKGSGVTVMKLNELIKKFEESKKMMKKMSNTMSPKKGFSKAMAKKKKKKKKK